MSMPDVNSLFAGRTVFLTGGSGFVGQVIIEKFLHDVPDVARLYVLVRASKGKSADERWAGISNGVLFTRVRADCPQALQKVVPVEGDITIDDMGLSEGDLKRVLEETSVVMHCAATVKFNDTLRSAIELNVKGVQRMISMCKRMPLLESFVHCSTCYVNVDKEGDIEEKQYPGICDPHKMIEGQGWMTDDMLDGITQSMTGKYFNTYCFTKRIAEELVRRECVDLPTLILRPAIVAGIWKDGVPGWADSIQGVTAVALGWGTGTVPRMPCNGKNPLDVVPVDVVSNMMIVAAAYRLHLTAQKDRSLPVFHCGTSHLNPFPIEHFCDVSGSFLTDYPLEKFIFAPTTGIRGNPVVEDYLHVVKHTVLGPSLDRLGGMLGKKPFWERTFGKVREVYELFIPFVSKRFIFKADNMLELIDVMHPEDVEKFDFDVRKIDWTSYCADFLFGMKAFLIKNDIMSDKNLAKTRKSVMIHDGFEVAANLLLGWLLSVLLTGSLSSWVVALSIGLATYCYLNCGLFKRIPIGTIDNYRKRMNAAIEQSPDNNNSKP